MKSAVQKINIFMNQIRLALARKAIIVYNHRKKFFKVNLISKTSFRFIKDNNNSNVEADSDSSQI